MKRKLIFVLLCCFTLLLFTACGEEGEKRNGGDDSGYAPSKVVARTGDYYLSKADDLAAGEDDWVILALARNGRDVPEGLFDRYYSELEALLMENGGVIPDVMNSAYARVALTVAAIGKDPSNVGGYDLFAPLNDVEATVGQGVNGASWALLAAAGCGKTVPAEDYLSYILSTQHDDGGFDVTGVGASDVDITAMVLQALSFYTGREDVDTAVAKAVTFLSEAQEEDGAFATMGTPSAESCAQVLVALCAQNISVDDERFVKNGHSVYDALMAYYLDDATFCHSLDIATSDKMATEQSYYAVVALDRMEKNENFLYDLYE